MEQGDDAQVYTHDSIQGHVIMEIFRKASGNLGMSVDFIAQKP